MHVSVICHIPKKHSLISGCFYFRAFPAVGRPFDLPISSASHSAFDKERFT
jgi:hypothetical protein